MIAPEDILTFWFPVGLDADEHRHAQQLQWWFGGGSNAELAARFASVPDAAIAGDLDSWAEQPRSRLALIIALDQFTRGLRAGSAQAYSGDEKAIALALEGVKQGHFDRLPNVWEKLFFGVSLGHSENLEAQDLSVRLASNLIDEAPPHLRRIYEFSASQARGHRDVIARFGRHPHRNATLGRPSTPEEVEYLATVQPVHQRSFQS